VASKLCMVAGDNGVLKKRSNCSASTLIQIGYAVRVLFLVCFASRLSSRDKSITNSELPQLLLLELRSEVIFVLLALGLAFLVLIEVSLNFSQLLNSSITEFKTLIL
jgi:hypothetical protein